jgi:pheromone shutdown protein TraB
MPERQPYNTQNTHHKSDAREAVMEKTNRKRVLLGGLLAGVVLNILFYAILAVFDVTGEIGISWIVFWFITGILSVWLYSAIRPRYGAGSKTTIIAGLAVGILCGLFYSVTASGGTPVAGLIILVMVVVATLAGAWVYKEQE